MAKSSNAESMLPEDSVDIDMSELRVDFTQEELSSEARDYSPVPGGKYVCTITDWELRRSNSSKNNGKPYWAITLRVNDDNEKYAGRKFWANVMLFNGALYSYTQLAKALGGEFEESLKTGKIPHGDNLVGKEVTAVIVKKVDTYKIEKGEWDADSGEPKPMKNEVSGFKAVGAGTVSSGGGSGSLMP
jgi:hypothetical protein